MKRLSFTLALAASMAFFALGCNEPKADETTTITTGSGSAPQTSTQANESKGGASYDATLADTQRDGAGTAPPKAPATDSRKPKAGEEVAVLETGQGKIILMFFLDKAPKHVENFKKLVKQGFYDGTKFHRTIPGFMIQGGDPNTKKSDRSSWGTGGPGYSIDAEFNDVHHAKGILSMARSQDPNSAGSQFFIMVGDAPFLDNQYTAFGKVVSGQDVADKIVALPAENELATNPVAIKKATIQKWPVK